MQIHANLPPTSDSLHLDGINGSPEAAIPHAPSPGAAAFAALETAICQLDNARDAIMALETQKVAATQGQSELLKRVEALQHETDDLRVQLDKFRVESQSLGHRNAALQEEGRVAGEENARLNHSIAELARSLEHREQATSELQGVVQQKSQENAELARALEHKEGFAAELARVVETKERERLELERAVEHREQEKGELARTVEGKERERVELVRAVEIKEKEAADLTRVVEHKDKEKHELARAVEQKEKENDDLFAQILDLHDLQINDLPTLIIEMARQLTGAEVGLFTQADGDDVIASLGMDDLKPGIADALFEFTRRVRAENAPLIENDSEKLPDGAGLVNLSALPVAARGKETGVLLLANKRRGPFNEHDTRLLLAIGQHAGIALENVRLHHQLNEAYASTIAVLADAIEAKDAYTRGHCESVMRLAVEVGRRLDLKGEKLDEVRYSALLHDIGKIGVPDGILLKPGRLMDEEFMIIQKHPAIGRDLVARVPTLMRLTDAILHHHEKWDGSGYPEGLAGEGIPLVARIVGAVDAFDAMTTPRPYRNAVSHQEAVAEMKRCAGTQFDPQIVDLIDQILNQGMKVNPEPHQTERSILAGTLAELNENPTPAEAQAVEEREEKERGDEAAKEIMEEQARARYEENKDETGADS